MKTTKLLPASAQHRVNNKSSAHAVKNVLKLAIQVALAGSVLASGMASAKLLDRGPADATISFPLWYRDTDGLALGLCRSVTDYCFPLAANPAGFPGNIGDEAFYSLIEFKNTATGSDFQYRYMGALEASYLPGPTPKRGDETVFARIRITFNFNDVNKSGTYVVTHPYGVHTFENVQATTKQNMQGSQAANYFTVDVPIGNGFDGALEGPVGPFIKWDTDLPLIVGAEEFVGDPTIPHTFTGSPFGTNKIRIQGPVGSNLDGLGNDFIEEYLGSVLGQKWTAPIAQALKVDSAYKVRKAGTNGAGVDVWATSSPDQRLIVTGDGMPSLQLYPSGTVPGKYHGHIEYPSTQAIPPQITVSSLSSNPVISVSTALKDGVEISKASFDTASRQILVVAHSSDEISNPGLAVEGLTGAEPNTPVTPPAVSTVMTKAQCPVTITDTVSVCFSGYLPAAIEPSESISVVSTESGFHADHLLSINGAPQNPVNPPVATTIAAPGFSVSTGGATELTPALPSDAWITQQPTSGTIALLGGVWTFTANATAAVGTDSFRFVRQAANNAPVSNVATGNLTLSFNPTAPTAVADQFAATYAGTAAAKTKTVAILGNDRPASANALDRINPALTSLTIVTAPTKGNLVKLASGLVTYVTKTATAVSGGADFFTYTVNNSSTPPLASNLARVDITNFSAAEVVRVTSAKYTIAQNKWDMVGTTSWFGANLTSTTATCWVGTATVPTITTLIGSATVDNLGGFNFSTAAKAPVAINNAAMRCRTSNGGLAAGVTLAK